MNKHRAFTLIELLIVITIIGILATIVLVSLRSVRVKARDARRIADVQQLMLAMELYLDDHSQYPERGAVGLPGSIPRSVGSYLDPSPQDPGNAPALCQPEGYHWWGNTGQAQKYCLWACLEEGGGLFFAASPKGTRKLENPPSGLDCW